MSDCNTLKLYALTVFTTIVSVYCWIYCMLLNRILYGEWIGGVN